MGGIGWTYIPTFGCITSYRIVDVLLLILARPLLHGVRIPFLAWPHCPPKQANFRETTGFIETVDANWYQTLSPSVSVREAGAAEIWVSGSAPGTGDRR